MTAYPWWLLSLAGVGAAALMTILVSLFGTLGRRPQELRLTQAPRVDSDDFVQAVAGTVNAPVVSGGHAQVLNNGVEIFPAMLAAFRGAKRSINVMTYIWEKGTVSDRVTEVLIEKAKEGVEVRVMLDSMGGTAAPTDELRRLKEAGGRVEWFRELKIGKLSRYHKRNHRRAIVVDGLVGFTGGASIADKWIGDADAEDHWRDMMVEVRGHAASYLQAAFSQLWAESCGEILVGPGFYPHERERLADVPEVVCHVNIISSPASESHPLRKVFWLSFRCARERIFVASPYFVPDDHLRQILADRARAGVDVRVLVPNDLTDAKPVRWASHSYYDELLSAGVRIFEYQGTFMHGKFLVVDGAWSVVGSANMDVRSKELNQENVIGILDEQFGRRLDETFLADLDRSREIRLDEWRRRGLWPKVRERFFVLFAEQY